MGKTKIMLSAVAALAASGGVFALKSKKIGLTPLYTIDSFEINGPQSCDYFLAEGTINTHPILSFYYYVTLLAPIVGDGANCTYKYYTLEH